LSIYGFHEMTVFLTEADEEGSNGEKHKASILEHLDIYPRGAFLATLALYSNK
jgi:hypothetical protein